MRRITAVAVTTGALVAGLGAVAAPASASPGPVAFKVYAADAGTSLSSDPSVNAAAPSKPKKWKAKNSFDRVAAWGKWRRGPHRTFGPGSNTDGGRDGWQACARLKTTKGRQQAVILGCVVDKRTGRAVDRAGRADFKFNLPRGEHFYVQEVRRYMRTGVFKYGAWKRIY